MLDASNGWGDFAPLSVVPYHKDFLVDFIRAKTGWCQRGLISDKQQLNYLCNYLESNGRQAKTLVFEDEYVDRHYLEDYSEYYARCFSDHRKKCARVHFFSCAFTLHDFLKTIEGQSKRLANRLAADYLGYAVVRPIPQTFFARICLRPYKRLTRKNSGHKLITKPNPVSLFGLSLNVNTSAFLEQDKVLSACATSAIWTLLNATPDTQSAALPSPSAITKSAFHQHHEGARTFPTVGLTTPQVARSLKHFELEPTILDVPVWGNSDFVDDLREIAYAYVSNDIPILVGGDVYDVAENPPKLRGQHFVCALGFHRGSEANLHGLMKMRAHAVDKLYVHDDRYGPFLRLDMAPENFVRQVEEGKSETARGLPMLVKDKKVDLFVPDVIVIGHYHKIRITYQYVRNLCSAFHSYLMLALDRLIQGAEQVQGADRDFYLERVNAVRMAANGIWDIRLDTNNNIKNGMLARGGPCFFNGHWGKSAFALKSLPKYLWRCRVHPHETTHSEDAFVEFICDATEIPQGPVVIGHIAYGQLAEAFWKYVEKQVNERAWDAYDVEAADKKNIDGILRYFSAPTGRSYLNTVYGLLRMPARLLKTGELDTLDNFKRRPDVMVVRRGDNNCWERLETSKKYIWVIDQLGDLAIGLDIEAPGASEGHPTLIDGRPARLGGELVFSSERNCWLANLKSRAYSGHLLPGSDEAKTYLGNVIKHNFDGLGVEPVLEGGADETSY